MERDVVDSVLEQWKTEHPASAAPAHAFAKRVARLAWHLEQATAAELEPLGIDLAEFDVLVSLLRQGKPYTLTPTELSRAGLVSMSGMTKRLDRLERRGLAQRTADPADRRSLKVSLTAEGARVARAAVEARDRAVRRVTAPAGERELARLASALRRMTLPLDAEA